MGKGFNNYMCKKFFHPASRDNLKRVWMAEQKADSYKKKQEELRMQYEKEQDLYTNKALLSKESKDKLSVNFMYEPPPGTKKEREREDYEPEFKFEWQRKFNAPREDYCKGDSEIRDQPFGIQVRNVRCIKCHKWGHINTDKECPMYNQFSSSSMEKAGTSVNPMLLVQQMREDGLAMKKSALTVQQQMNFASNQQFVPSDDEEEKTKQSEVAFLQNLTKKQKKKLLRKLEKLEQSGKKKHKKLKKSKKHKRKSCSSEAESNDSGDSVKEASRRSISKKSKIEKIDKYEKCNIKEEKSPDVNGNCKMESPIRELKLVLGRTINFSGREDIFQGSHGFHSHEIDLSRKQHGDKKQDECASTNKSSFGTGHHIHKSVKLGTSRNGGDQGAHETQHHEASTSRYTGATKKLYRPRRSSSEDDTRKSRHDDIRKYHRESPEKYKSTKRNGREKSKKTGVENYTRKRSSSRESDSPHGKKKSRRS